MVKATPARGGPVGIPAAAWAKAKRLYADPGSRVSDIAKLVGLAAIQLSNEAKKRGWPLRTAGKTAKPTGTTKRTTKAPAKALAKAPATTTASAAARKGASGTGDAETAKKAAPKPIVLVRRVYNTIDGELTKLEQQKGASSQDRERASRALSQMVNSLEKAIDMQREMTKDTTKGSGQKDKEALAHAEDLRRAVAERIERLHRERLAGKRSK